MELEVFSITVGSSEDLGHPYNASGMGGFEIWGSSLVRNGFGP